ncbi:MAG: TonB-dependent receptor, partial [Candidatus Acidiferrales bacterium]
MSSSFRSFAVKLFAVCALFMLVGAGVYAQSTVYGAISGAVADPQNKAILGASVTVRNVATNATSEPVKTDSNGRYLVTNLTPAVYEITITSANFAEYKQQNIIVEVGRTTNLDIKMVLAGQQQTIAVTAEAPVINAEANDFSTNVNKVAIDNLPLNIRRWSVFALATPGSVTDGTFGDVSFRGISGFLNNNTVDGGDNNDAYFAEEKGRTRIAYSTSANAIQEFQVNTSNYSAEYGRAAGAVVNAVTKSGSNTIHGTGFYYNRDNSWGAYNPFATAAVQTAPGVFQIQPIKPTDERQQFGGDIGGYLIKDKLFWYFNFDDHIRNFPGVAIPTNPTFFFTGITVAAPPNITPSVGNPTGNGCFDTNGVPILQKAGSGANEGQQLFCRGITQAQANSALGFLDSLTGTVPRTGDQTIYFPKIDWKPTPNNTITLSYNRLRWNSPFGIQTASVVSRGTDSFGDDFVKGESAQARWTSAIGTSMTNEARFLFSRDFEFEFTDPAATGEPVSPLTSLSPQIDITGTTSFTFGAPDFLQRAALPDEHRYQFADSFGWNHGRHFFKFGADINIVNDRISNLFQSLGEYSYNDRVDFITDYLAKVDSIGGGTLCSTQFTTGNTAIPCYSTFTQGFGPLGFSFNTYDIGFFGQDDFHVNRRLTLNLGLRWEKEIFPAALLPNSAAPQTAALPSDNKDFGPRIGFAWDVFGTSKTIVRGGAGIYYGRVINGNIFNALADTGVAADQISASFFPTTSAGAATPGVPLYPNILPAFSPAGSKNIVYFAPDSRLPQIDQFDLAIEREIANNTVVSISYIGSIGRFLPLAQDTNFFAPTMETFTIAGSAPLNLLQGPSLPLAGTTFSVPVYRGIVVGTCTVTPGSCFVQARPNTNFNQMTQISTIVRSYYHGLALQFNRRMTHGLQIQSSYTFSKALDDDQISSATLSGNTPQGPANILGDYGPSNFDLRQKFVADLIWTPDAFSKGDNKGAKWLLGGWTIAPILTVTSGLPFSASVSGNLPGPPATTLPTPPIPGSETTGVVGIAGSSRVPFFERNAFRMPGYLNTDFRIAKDIHFTERCALQLSVDFFNLFNNDNITSVGTTLFSSIGGSITAPTLNYPTFGTSTFSTVSNGNNGTFAPTPRQV